MQVLFEKVLVKHTLLSYILPANSLWMKVLEAVIVFEGPLSALP